MSEQIKVIEIDGVEYEIEKFSDHVKSVVKIRSKWSDELEIERIAATKTEAAIKQLDAELIEMIKRELQ